MLKLFLALHISLFLATAAYAEPVGYVTGQTANQVTQVRKVQRDGRTAYAVTYWPSGRVEKMDKEPAGTVWR